VMKAPVRTCGEAPQVQKSTAPQTGRETREGNCKQRVWEGGERACLPTHTSRHPGRRRELEHTHGRECGRGMEGAKEGGRRCGARRHLRAGPQAGAGPPQELHVLFREAQVTILVVKPHEPQAVEADLRRKQRGVGGRVPLVDSRAAQHTTRGVWGEGRGGGGVNSHHRPAQTQERTATPPHGRRSRGGEQLQRAGARCSSPAPSVTVEQRGRQRAAGLPAIDTTRARGRAAEDSGEDGGGRWLARRWGENLRICAPRFQQHTHAKKRAHS
jgi:hypothetical protein